jgi:imidazolonepropionase-like amidohydrolase
MPGMTDAHIHSNNDVLPGTTQAQRAFTALSSVQRDLYAGFTTVLDVDDRGGFNTVDMRDAINAGELAGPRMQVAGQSLNFRGGGYVRDFGANQFYSSYTQDKNINGPWLARAAVREAHNHGTDYVKVYATDDFVGEHYMWRDGKFQFFYSLTVEEFQAIVDEAHRLGMKVACHDYGGDGKDPCLLAGVDAPQHLETLTDEGVKLIKEKHLIYTPTIDDVVHLDKRDKALSGGTASRLTLLEAAVKKAKAAGVEIAFGSGATSPPGGDIPHGTQADQFPWLLKWGFTPAEALATTYITSPKDLNYNMDREIGTIEKGKYADIIAVPGDPLKDITEMQRVKFVMKGGIVYRDDANAAMPALLMAH